MIENTITSNHLIPFQSCIDYEASRHSVSALIHPDDHIFHFIFNHPGFPSTEAAISYYFEDGAKSAEQFKATIAMHLEPAQNAPKVLEFASGYGCVTRHLAKDRTIDLFGCDIHPQAINFLKEKIGIKTIISSQYPEVFDPQTEFDVVFALSFFSHMPITTWSRWLVRLLNSVRSEGILIFTTHGLKSLTALGNPTLPAMGFYFSSQSEQMDLPTEQYGLTVTTSEFVKNHILSIPFVELIEFREGYWWEHQDVYILKKTSKLLNLELANG